VAALSEELMALRADPDEVEARAAAADAEDECWIQDTGIRLSPPPARYSFEYVHGEITVIVYYEVDSTGEIGPFQVWGVPDCAELVVVGDEGE
jgi:hypothetical protein